MIVQRLPLDLPIWTTVSFGVNYITCSSPSQSRTCLCQSYFPHFFRSPMPWQVSCGRLRGPTQVSFSSSVLHSFSSGDLVPPPQAVAGASTAPVSSLPTATTSGFSCGAGKGSEEQWRKSQRGNGWKIGARETPQLRAWRYDFAQICVCFDFISWIFRSDDPWWRAHPHPMMTRIEWNCNLIGSKTLEGMGRKEGVRVGPDLRGSEHVYPPPSRQHTQQVVLLQNPAPAHRRRHPRERPPLPRRTPGHLGFPLALLYYQFLSLRREIKMNFLLLFVCSAARSDRSSQDRLLNLDARCVSLLHY